MDFMNQVELFMYSHTSKFNPLYIERTYESFTPAVPSVFLSDPVKESNTLGAYVSKTTSNDTHLIALELAEQVLGFKTNYIAKNSFVSRHNSIFTESFSIITFH